MEYLTLSQTLEKLKNVPKFYQPQGVAQLSDACIKKKITPVFQYNAYSLTNVCGVGDNAEYINIPIKGYLTSKHISNVFNWSSKREKKVEFTEAIVYELTPEEEHAPKESEIVLARTTFHHLRPIGNAKSIHFDVQAKWDTRLYSSSNEKDAERIRDLGGVEISQNDLLFPTEQVEDYIDSFICDNEDNFLNSFVFDSSAANAKIEQQQKEIDSLNKKIEQAGKPADSKEKSSRNQDQKVIAILALLLAQKYKTFKNGETPNAAQIADAIYKLAIELGIDNEDMTGLKAAADKISKAVKAYTGILYKTEKPK